MSNSKASTEAIRQARTRLFARIRNDWEFEYPLESPQAGNDPAVSADQLNTQTLAQPTKPSTNNGANGVVHSPPSSSSPADAQLPAEGPSVLEWHERTYASSDPSDWSNDDGEAKDTTTAGIPTSTARLKTSPAQQTKSSSAVAKPSKFRSSLFAHREALNRTPSAGEVGEANAGNNAPRKKGVIAQDPAAAEQAKKRARKLRRKKRLEEEMQWNEGLRYWAARRDAWCCARVVYDEHSSEEEEDEQIDENATAEQAEPTPPATPPVSPDKNKPFAHRRTVFSSSVPRDSSTSLRQRPTSKKLPRRKSSRHTTTLVPLAGSILPQSDPTRSNLTPALYPSIYSKVVKQSLTPSVPINLSHVISALVEGWKADGEWPTAAQVAASQLSPTTGAAVHHSVPSAAPTGGHLYLHVRGGASALAKTRAAAAKPQPTPGYGFSPYKCNSGTEAMLPGYRKSVGNGRGGTDAMLPGYLVPGAAAKKAKMKKLALAANSSNAASSSDGANFEPSTQTRKASAAKNDKRARRDVANAGASSWTTFPVREEEGEERASVVAPAAPKTNGTGDAVGDDAPSPSKASPAGQGAGGVRRGVAKMGKALRLTLSPGGGSSGGS